MIGKYIIDGSGEFDLGDFFELPMSEVALLIEAAEAMSGLVYLNEEYGYTFVAMVILDRMYNRPQSGQIHLDIIKTVTRTVKKSIQINVKMLAFYEVRCKLRGQLFSHRFPNWCGVTAL